MYIVKFSGGSVWEGYGEKGCDECCWVGDFYVNCVGWMRCDGGGGGVVYC